MHNKSSQQWIIQSVPNLVSIALKQNYMHMQIHASAFAKMLAGIFREVLVSNHLRYIFGVLYEHLHLSYGLLTQVEYESSVTSCEYIATSVLSPLDRRSLLRSIERQVQLCYCKCASLFFCAMRYNHTTFFARIAHNFFRAHCVVPQNLATLRQTKLSQQALTH